MDHLPITIQTESAPYIRPHKLVKKRKKSSFLLFFLLFCGIGAILFCAFLLPEGTFEPIFGYFSTLQTTANSGTTTTPTTTEPPLESTTEGTTTETTDIYFWEAELPAGAVPILPKNYSADAQGIYADNMPEAELSSIIPSFPKANNGEISVLILNSHAFESYADTGAMYYTDAAFASNREDAQRVTAVAKALCASLEEHNIGAEFIDTMTTSALGAYKNGKIMAELAMKKHEGAVLVIDIHRAILTDDSGALLRPIYEVSGETVAQTRILLGTKVNFEENAAVALSFYENMKWEYPHLCMPLTVTDNAYLQELALPVLTLEIGTAGNDVTEAERAAERIGAVIGEIMGG